jgi:hypothetical protein
MIVKALANLLQGKCILFLPNKPGDLHPVANSTLKALTYF